MELRDWQLSASIESVAASGALASDAFVLVWNPCDGHHLSRLSEHPPAAIATEARAGFGTHWCLMPDGPDVAPEDWHPMDTLEGAYDSDLIPCGGMVLLWSPTGAHRLSWLLHDGVMMIAVEGQLGRYVGWRVPPEGPGQ